MLRNNPAEARRQKLIVIVGPTASGKSELAVRLARKFNGEIISADSRQVYRGLDIGTGKISGKWHPPITIISIRSYQNDSKFLYKGIPHHCIDFVPPKKTFSVAEYKARAENAIRDISSRGKIPIIAGGTAFWIDALVYDLDFPDVPPNPSLRKKLEKKSIAKLLKILQKADPKRARTIEQKNPRRLIRAIEIARALGKVPAITRHTPYRVLWIGLNPSYETWSHKMKRRVGAMLTRGIILETKMLIRQGVSKKRVHEFGFEYRAVLDYTDKKMTKEALLERIIRESIRYARRQMAWWKRNKEIWWISKSNEAIQLVSEFLQSPL
ncbi:MAG: tRNA dimethylallyltransferase [Parcubacteria group bacterium Gr01-1014_33]|nr:MAG: tRNA dimethylallyltransferase [Parcubacteria group bacterium Gr01-1014_33]